MPATNSNCEISDFDLVAQIQKSDHRAFQMLYGRYWKSIYSFVFSILKNEDVAKDLLQDVWVKFWEKRKLISNDNIKAYLYTLARYRVYKEIRDNKKFEIQLNIIDTFLSENNTSNLMDLADAHKTIDDKISKLSPRQKEIFILNRIEGFSNTEIAEKLGLSKRTVENHISAAMSIVRDEAVVITLFLLTEL